MDNAWLATALIMVRNTKPEFRERADALLKPMDFGIFYDAYDRADPLKHPGQIRGTFDVDTRAFGLPHQLINTGSTELRYLGISTAAAAEVVDYPDSNKVGVTAGVKDGDFRTATYRGMGRMQPADYFDSESD